jgi:STE24 endopeptidase
MSIVVWIVVALMVARLGSELLLSRLNRLEILRHAGAMPPAFAGVMDEATYARSVEYSLAKNAFGQVELLWSAVVLAAVVFSGVLPLAWEAWSGLAGPAAWSGALFLVLTAIALSIPDLPFDWWGTFRLEARFGFNKSTPGLWITDKLKGAALGLAIGFPLVWLLLALVGLAGGTWWVWGWAAMIVFQLLMMVLYPKFILPLFNKLTPLPEGGLRDSLMALADRAKFSASTIEVMDGSKRSGHSNAFFTGFGRFRRIVLFDTLIEQLERDELEAVLAHEIGHYKRGHIPRSIVLGAAVLLGGFAALAWLAGSPAFLGAFGFEPGEIAPAFLLFALLGGLASYWLSPLGNLLSRKHEYEADAFAANATGGADAMIRALRKLSQKNLSNLTPHPWFSFFHYSHPTLLERERALRAA